MINAFVYRQTSLLFSYEESRLIFWHSFCTTHSIRTEITMIMKKSIILTLCATAFSAFTMAHTVKADLTDAVVFLNGAELHHNATISIQPGDNDITLTHLSPMLDLNSLQIALGTTGVVLSNYEFAVDHSAAKQYSPIALQLKDSIDYYTDCLCRNANEQQAIKDMQTLLQEGIKQSLSVDKQRISNANIDSQLKYYQQQHLLLAEQLLSLEKQQNIANRKLEEFNKQFAQEEQANQTMGTLRLKLNASKAQTLPIAIRYFTQGAYWRMSYDMNITAPTAPILLTSKANVIQRTGLTWENVHLILSTGRPSHNNTLPEFDTWFLREQTYGYAAKRGMFALNAVATAAPVQYDFLEEEAGDATIESYVTQTEEQLSKEYIIDLPYTIYGNGKEQIIALGVQQIQDVTYGYYTAPKLSSEAYFTAQINNLQQLNLMSGTAHITYNGTFYGDTRINPNTTADSLLLTLGTDPEIAVKRELISDYKATKTIGSTTTKTIAYRITIRNNKRQATDIRWQEPYPVSGNKSIIVELTDRTTQAAFNDTERGILTYECTLQPGESREFVVEYKLKYPKNMRINL